MTVADKKPPEGGCSLKSLRQHLTTESNAFGYLRIVRPADQIIQRHVEKVG